LYIKKRTILIFTSIIVLIFSAAGVYAATTQSSITNTIYACQTKGDNLLRVVDANTACKKNENVLSWNVVGPKGDKGDTGAPGPKGDTGATGPQGPKGDTGAIGVTGTAGTQGLAGVDGAVGPQGPSGVNGKDGAQGPEGLAGKDGSVGPVGSQGPKGDPGPTGPTGPSKVVGGYVNADGTIISGSGYTVTKNTPGLYMIQFAPGVFTKSPVMTATPGHDQILIGHGTADVRIFPFGVDSEGNSAFTVTFIANGAAVDTPFLFIATDVQ
jgi:hypothetical protein